MSEVSSAPYTAPLAKLILTILFCSTLSRPSFIKNLLTSYWHTVFYYQKNIYYQYCCKTRVPAQNAILAIPYNTVVRIDDPGRIPLAGSIRLILLIRAMERDVPADRIGSSGTSQKWRSKSIQHAGRLSNILTCFYANNGHCIELCSKNDAIWYEYEVILQKSTSLMRFPFLF